MSKKRSTSTDKPRVNPELDGFDIEINSFGEIKTNFDIDRINQFLNEKVDDKKLRDRDDYHENQPSKKQKPGKGSKG